VSCRRAREDARRPQTPGANGKHLLGLINDAVIALQLVLQLERVLCLPQRPLNSTGGYERQMFICSACDHAIERIVDAHGNSPE
jgi:hypothetical protein